MNAIQETLQLDLPPDLALAPAAAAKVLGWCCLMGVPETTRSRVELPFVEALNNAIEHGCAGKPGARVEVRVRWRDGRLEVRVHDPGWFDPGPSWTELPEDPLAEGGRGGFIINQNTDCWEHINRPTGHTLLLAWNCELEPGKDPLNAAKNEEILDQVTAELAANYETLAALTDFTGLLATSDSFSRLLVKVRERLGATMPLRHLLVRFLEDGVLRLHSSVNESSVEKALPLDSPFAEVLCATQRKSYVGGAEGLDARDPLLACGSKFCVMAVEFGGQTLGAVAAVRGEGDPAFRGAETGLLQATADFIGIARATDNLWQEKARSMALEREIRVAAEIQQSLLPSEFPECGPWKIWAGCRPAREVGGDYFDVVAGVDGGAVVFVADVMGKGVPAALFAAMIRISLRALALEESAPGPILTRLNRILCPDLERLGVFVTALLAVLPSDPGRPALFANAGHCSPAVFGPANDYKFLGGGNLPLGVIRDTEYESLPLEIAPGGRLVLFTDGCYEIEAPRGGMLGEEGFMELAALHRHLPPEQFVRNLLEITGHARLPRGHNDDRTLLAADWLP